MGEAHKETNAKHNNIKESEEKVHTMVVNFNPGRSLSMDTSNLVFLSVSAVNPTVTPCLTKEYLGLITPKRASPFLVKLNSWTCGEV